MKDLIRRLRKSAHKNCPPKYPVEQTLEWEAADALEQLRAEHEQAREQNLRRIEETDRVLLANHSLREQLRAHGVPRDTLRLDFLERRDVSLDYYNDGRVEVEWRVKREGLADSIHVTGKHEKVRAALDEALSGDAAVAAPGRQHEHKPGDILCRQCDYEQSDQANVTGDNAESAQTPPQQKDAAELTPQEVARPSDCFRAWLGSNEGRECRMEMRGAQQPYMDNRLWWAFMAGYRAVEDGLRESSFPTKPQAE